MFERTCDALWSELDEVDREDAAPADLLNEMTGLERVIRRASAAQWCAMAAFESVRRDEDRATYGLGEPMVGRSIPTEVGLALGIAPATARVKLGRAGAAVTDHPKLLGLVEHGSLSTGGLAMVMRETEVGQGLSKTTHVLREHPAITVSQVPGERDEPDAGLLNRMRADAPSVVCTMPTGHRYRRRPPPALGWGSHPPARRPPRTPQLSMVETKLSLDLLKARIRRAPDDLG